MNSWLKVPRIGTGKDADHYRPDLTGLNTVEYCAIHGNDIVLVMVATDTAPLAALKTDIAIKAEAVKLGAKSDWSPTRYAAGEVKKTAVIDEKPIDVKASTKGDIDK